MGGKLPGKRRMGFPCLGSDEHPAGILVQSVDDTGTQFPFLIVLGLEIIAIAEKQGVGDRTARTPGPGMNVHARWLVYDEDGIILIDYLELNVLRLKSGKDLLCPGNGNAVPFPHLLAFLHSTAIYGNYRLGKGKNTSGNIIRCPVDTS